MIEQNVSMMGLKKWSEFLAGNYDFDIETFLVTSLIPYSYTYMHKKGKYLAVDLEDIRKHTAVASKGFKAIVDKGFGVWLNYTETPKEHKSALHDCSVGTLALGTMIGFNKVEFYMENIGGNEDNSKSLDRRIRRGVNIKKDNPSDDKTKSFAVIKAVIESQMISYREYADRNGAGNQASKIYREVISFIDGCKAKKPDRTEFLYYLYNVNAIVYDLHSVPKLERKYKELSTATNIVKQLTAEELAGIVPYYVLHFHEFARKTQSETNIYNLSFQLTTILQNYRTSLNGTDNKKTRTKKLGYEDDSL